MVGEQAAGWWNDLKGKVKQRWGELTDDDLTVAEGQMDELAGRIQRRYGGTKEEIRRQLEQL